MQACLAQPARSTRVSPRGSVIARYTGLSTGELPQYIVAAPDGNLYFTEDAFSSSVNDKIGRITTSGKITEIGTLAPNSRHDEDRKSNSSNRASLRVLARHFRWIFRDRRRPDGKLWVGGTQTIWVLSY
jgi:streptogramin lyase